MNEYLFVNGAFEVNRIFVIKAETEEQAYEEFLNAYKEAERVITETK